jgi:hypothetical protein
MYIIGGGLGEFVKCHPEEGWVVLLKSIFAFSIFRSALVE